MSQTLYLVFGLCFLFQFPQSPYDINGFILLNFTNEKRKKRERPWTVCSQVTTDGSIQDLHGGWQILKPMVLSVRLYEQTTHMQCIFAGLLLHFRHYSGDITVNNIHKVFVSTNGYPSWGNKKWVNETINEQNNRKQGQISWRKQQKEDDIFGKGWFFRQGGPGGLLWAENRMGRRSQTEKDLEEKDSGRGSSLSQGNAPGLFEENLNLAQGWWPKGEVPPAASWPLVITEKSWKIYSLVEGRRVLRKRIRRARWTSKGLCVLVFRTFLHQLECWVVINPHDEERRRGTLAPVPGGPNGFVS